MALHLKTPEFSLPKDALCQIWLKLANWFWRWRWNCENVMYRQIHKWTKDNRHAEKLNWAFSSGELKCCCKSTSFDLFKYLHINWVWSSWIEKYNPLNLFLGTGITCNIAVSLWKLQSKSEVPLQYWYITATPMIFFFNSLIWKSKSRKSFLKTVTQNSSMKLISMQKSHIQSEA